ncbi:hypothetical protein [Lysinibacillus phage vB_LspM-01]|nr:hypothetical protein [Lysinibacillus phage vB_LspM-01]
MWKPLSGKQPNYKTKKRMLIQMAKVSGVQHTVIYKNEETGEETKYVLQHPGVRKGLEIKNTFINLETNKIDLNLRNEALMKDVIVNPKTNWDYWEEKGIEEAEYVFGEAAKFLSGSNSN